MNRTKWTAGILSAAVVLLAGIGVGTADARGATPAKAAAPKIIEAPGEFMLPFFGADLSITVTTGPGGNLTDVSIDPADGLTAVKAKPRKVVITNTDGTGKLTIKSKRGEQRVEAKSASLADLAGDGGWSGDVFGNGTTSTVTFTIVDNGGVPDIQNVVATPGAGITADVGDVKLSTDDDGDASAKVSIVFTLDGQSRTLSIKAKVEVDDDDDDDDSASSTPGDTEASVRITLSRIRGVAQSLEEAAGPKQWTGLLCDGSTATIDYTVTPEGNLVLDLVNPEPDRVKDEGDRIEVRFSGDERVRIDADVDDGQITVNVKEKIRCRDADNPTVNGSEVPTTADDDDDDDDDDHGGRHGRGGDDDDDDRDGDRGGRDHDEDD